MFATVSHSHPSLIFVDKVGAYPTGGGRLQALPANISLGCRWLTVTKPPSYDDTTVKSFIVQARGAMPWPEAICLV
jgi:hypothetical protein